MKLHRKSFTYGVVVVVMAGLRLPGATMHKKYENPITKSTEQPDKVLFDKAVKGYRARPRFEAGAPDPEHAHEHLDQSEYLAKAKLAIADSCTTRAARTAYAQRPRREYKDFILFYPTWRKRRRPRRRSAEIQLKQMDKADRRQHATVARRNRVPQRAYKFPQQQVRAAGCSRILRNIQEVLAAGRVRGGLLLFWEGPLRIGASLARLDGITSALQPRR